MTAVTTTAGFRELTGCASLRDKIVTLEERLREMPQLDVETDHTFGPGFYARTIKLPAGATLTGKVHATEHLFILSKGELIVVTEDGRQHLKAPFQAVCRPGLKRAGHAITDVVCTNVHITEETDLVRLEAELIVPEGAALMHETKLELESASWVG
jgi:hypothetical protein